MDSVHKQSGFVKNPTKTVFLIQFNAVVIEKKKIENRK